MKALARSGRHPEEAMKSFNDWVTQKSRYGSPVFIELANQASCNRPKVGEAQSHGLRADFISLSQPSDARSSLRAPADALQNAVSDVFSEPSYCGRST
jgi:hypothetical protein